MHNPLEGLEDRLLLIERQARDSRLVFGISIIILALLFMVFAPYLVRLIMNTFGPSSDFDPEVAMHHAHTEMGGMPGEGAMATGTPMMHGATSSPAVMAPASAGAALHATTTLP